MHAAHAEREDLLSVGELPDPRGFRRDAAGLTDHPEDRRLVQGPLFVRTFKEHDGERDASVRLRRGDAPLPPAPNGNAPFPPPGPNSTPHPPASSKNKTPTPDGNTAIPRDPSRHAD